MLLHAPITPVAPFTPWAVLLAAGAGRRFGGDKPKQYTRWRGAPLYWQSVLTMRAAGMAGVVLVFPPQDVTTERERLAALMTGHIRLCHSERSEESRIHWKDWILRCAQNDPKLSPFPCLVAAGGTRRQDSVYAGLCAVPKDCTHILIHDTARPFASPALVERVCLALRTGAVGVIPAIALTDTIKEVTDDRVVRTPARESLRAVQTPQGFAVDTLREAFARADGITVTDDAALLELCGLPVTVIVGETGNHKITTPQDAYMLSAHDTPITPTTAITPTITVPDVFAPAQTTSTVTRTVTGFGYDVHRFGRGRPLKLGGVLMDGNIEVIAHSDGDVLLHALMDALLGCAGAGDIGALFPDTDAAFANADSAHLLAEVLRVVRQAGLVVTHVDCTVITQQPKIAPQREAICDNVARLLNMDTRHVNIKATTEEGLGFTGEKLGIKAVAVVTAQDNLFHIHTGPRQTTGV